MKKKLLLIALPALMALSGCSNAFAQSELKEDAVVESFVEDNLAHDEIFGASSISKGPSIKKMADLYPDMSYKIGYQIHFEEGSIINDDPDEDDLISIRFIAAIQESYSKMVWTRGLTSPNGTERLTFSNHSSLAPEYPELESKVVYTSLSNGDSDVMVAGGEDPENPYKDYTGFIVYSLTNIPYDTFVDYFVGVMLTLTPAEGDPLTSDVCVLKIERKADDLSRSALTFSFSKSKTGFFLYGMVNDVYMPSADSPTKGSNAASFTSDFKVGDEFIIIQRESNLFKMWTACCVCDDTNFTDDGFIITCKTAGFFTIYLNGSNEIWPTQFHLPSNYYIRGAVAGEGGWDPDENSSARFITDPDNTAILLNVTLSVGEFKVGLRTTWDGALGWDQVRGGAKDGEHIIPGASNNNIKCGIAGQYNFYIKDGLLYIERVLD